MAYSRFRELHVDFLDEEGHPEEGHQPAFHDQDGAPLFEAPEFALLHTVFAQNDVKSLHLYNDNPHMTIFQDLGSDAYWQWCYHPFVQAAILNGFDALHALLDIYVANPTLTEPLDQYLAHIPISLMNLACRGANRGIVQRLLSHDPLLGDLHAREDDSSETPLFSAAKSMRIENEGRIKHDSREKLA
ncbi:ankyrin [Penicillium verhagenii]|uniref:ankyrin n=1 Tax=Penicillium verhagenii TaxID=1562060 RepID=UPI00254559B7|nr:ankyrin [Penicillium verhagenii]KAJ5930316.1 ankyrin [Penicillium verhagenii]